MEVSNWIAPDGGMSLNENNFLQPYQPGRPKTADNDNAIHTLAVYIFLKRRLALIKNNFSIVDFTKEREWAFRFMTLTQSTVHGLYHRNPGRFTYVNSHDNYLGMAAICIIFFQPYVFESINSHWPIWNNHKPGEVEFVQDRPSGLFQPHTWFIMWLAEGKTSTWLQTIWHIGNLIFTSHFVKHNFQHDSHINAWLRMEATEMCLDKFGFLKRWMIKLAHKLNREKVDKKSGSYGHYFVTYYHHDHPIHRLAKEIFFGGENV